MSETVCDFDFCAGQQMIVSNCPDRARLEKELAGVRRDLLSTGSTANNHLFRAQAAEAKAEKAEKELAEAKRHIEDVRGINASLRGTLDEMIANQRAELRQQQGVNVELKRELDEANARIRDTQLKLILGRTGWCISRESHEQVVAENREFHKQESEKAIAEKDVVVSDLRSALASANEELDRRFKRIADIHKSWIPLSQWNAMVADNDKRSKQQAVMIADRDRHIAELQKGMHRVLEGKDKTIDELRERAVTLTNEIARFMQVNLMQNKNADYLHGLILDREQIIGELRGRIETLTAVTRTCCHATN